MKQNKRGRKVNNRRALEMPEDEENVTKIKSQENKVYKKDKAVTEEIKEHRMWETFLFVVLACWLVTEEFRYDAREAGRDWHVQLAVYLQIFESGCLFIFSYGFWKYRSHIEARKADIAAQSKRD